MQQQEIALRKTTFQLVTRADQLCNTWDAYQASSLALLNTVHNLQQQRDVVHSDELADVLQGIKVDAPHLLYKQTTRVEAALQQLDVFFDTKWRDLLDDWQRLERDAVHALSKHATIVPSAPGKLSSHALIQIAAISPYQTHQWIQTLAKQYKAQFHCKQMLLQNLMASIQPTPLPTLLDQWAQQTHIDHLDIQADLAERLKTYKHIKAAVESVQ
ncbi:hypothetical protein BC940DRAFT_293783 [Gongronella butleri]|nr:hypothetical protein BC940DRAFT_293783 [Gongronella butleri]